MKRLISVLLTLALVLCALSACTTTPESIIEKANKALKENPYLVTITMEFDSDNDDMDQVFSAMNMEIPVTVDGDNLSMDVSIDIMGYTANLKMTVVDKVMYYDATVMGQTSKMKASLSDSEYDEFKDNNSAEMMIKPEDFSSFSIEKKDGKTYINCADISKDGREELNELMENSLGSIGEATISDLNYQIVIKDGKYEEMNMTCEYTITVGSESYTVSFNLKGKFDYDNIESVKAPADANSYTKTDAGDLIG